MPPSSSHRCVLLLGEEDHAAGRFLKLPLAYFSGFGSTTSATRRLAVQRSMGSGDSDAIATSLVRSGPCLEGGLNFKGCIYGPIPSAKGVPAV